MQLDLITLPGDTPGHAWTLEVFRFSGREPSAPSAYIQAALHAEERGGTAALHRLIPRLAAAEADGRLRADVVIVPAANPIGAAQAHYHENQGRFDAASMVNFNRDHVLLPDTSPASLARLQAIADDPAAGASRRMKAALLRTALEHPIILDLHTDEDSPLYIYAHDALWPAARDLAVCMQAQAVVRWADDSGAAFEEAAFHPWLVSGRLDNVLVATVELRGISDVSPEHAEADAQGLYRFLCGRGVIDGEGPAADAHWDGTVSDIAHVDMIPTPVGGTLMYHAAPGQRVAAGDLLATVIHRPGHADGEVHLRAPQAGVILTRRYRRQVRAGDDLLKLLGDAPSATPRTGALES